MANDTNSFMAFPGITTHRLAFPNFIKDVFDKLAFKGSRDYGLLGYVLTDEEWLALPGNQEAFVSGRYRVYQPLHGKNGNTSRKATMTKRQN